MIQISVILSVVVFTTFHGETVTTPNTGLLYDLFAPLCVGSAKREYLKYGPQIKTSIEQDQ